MKIAILIYGEPREIEYCKRFWPFQYLTNHKIDYYYSMWSYGSCYSWISPANKHYTFDYKQIRDLSPKAYICLRPQDMVLPKNILCVEREYRHAYILQAGLNLISEEEKDQYDAFVLMRPDLFFSSESIDSIKSDFGTCIKNNSSAIVSNDIWTEDIFMILSRQDFHHLNHSDLPGLISTMGGHSVIHHALAKVFINRPKFLPETRNHIEVVRPSVTELTNPTLEQVKQQFYEWNNFKRLEI